jgi:hypothetical protein
MYVVAVEIEMILPEEDPSEPCYEPATVQFLKRSKNVPTLTISSGLNGMVASIVRRPGVSCPPLQQQRFSFGVGVALRRFRVLPLRSALWSL